MYILLLNLHLCRDLNPRTEVCFRAIVMSGVGGAGAILRVVAVDKKLVILGLQTKSYIYYPYIMIFSKFMHKTQQNEFHHEASGLFVSTN
mgnify:CR=1 FL=1